MGNLLFIFENWPLTGLLWKIFGFSATWELLKFTENLPSIPENHPSIPNHSTRWGWNEKFASLCDSIIQQSEKCVILYNSKSTQKKAQNCFCFFIDIILQNNHTKVMCAFFIIIIQQMSIDGQWNVEKKKIRVCN